MSHWSANMTQLFNENATINTYCKDPIAGNKVAVSSWVIWSVEYVGNVTGNFYIGITMCIIMSCF